MRTMNLSLRDNKTRARTLAPGGVKTIVQETCCSQRLRFLSRGARKV
jgi:hypothetical protein